MLLGQVQPVYLEQLIALHLCLYREDIILRYSNKSTCYICELLTCTFFVSTYPRQRRFLKLLLLCNLHLRNGDVLVLK